VFEYGSSLYLGWMMWRTRRGGSLVVRFVADVVGGLFGHTDPVKLMLRTERPRAMREAVHSVCREGLHVAVEGLSVPENYGFPSGLPPVEDGVLAAAVPPPSAPVPSAMAMPSSLREEPAGQAFVPPPGFEQTQVYEPPQPQPVFGEQSIPGQQPQQYQDPQQADFFRRTQPSPPQDPHPGYQHPDQQQGQQGQRQQQQWDGR
jgi:hypothetical protein